MEGKKKSGQNYTTISYKLAKISKLLAKIRIKFVDKK
jgi:hypothetical protein